MKDTRIIIRINAKLKEQLKKKAKESRRSMSDYVHLLIEDAVIPKKKK
ncbi:MAG: ribbon-helix-helix protein, CopG family [Bacteroidota bacterium]